MQQLVQNPIDQLRKKEHLLHEQLATQTRELQHAREKMSIYQTAVEETMTELQEVRHRLYQLWQQSP